MKEPALHFLICAIAFSLLSAYSISSAIAQSQALNGLIEGIVSEQNNAAMSNGITTVYEYRNRRDQNLQRMKTAGIAFRSSAWNLPHHRRSREF